MRARLAVVACLLALLCAVPSFAFVRNAATDSSATIGNTSTQVVAADALRGLLLIHNPNTSNTFACNLSGGTALANGSGNVQFPTGATLILDQAVPTNAINCIGSGGGTVVSITTITNVSN